MLQQCCAIALHSISCLKCGISLAMSHLLKVGNGYLLVGYALVMHVMHWYLFVGGWVLNHW